MNNEKESDGGKKVQENQKKCRIYSIEFLKTFGDLIGPCGQRSAGRSSRGRKFNPNLPSRKVE